MTSAFIFEANKLKNVQLNLEKSQGIFFEHLDKHDGGKEIKLFYSELETVRNKELEAAQKEVLNTVLQFEKLQARLNDQELQNIDLTMLKKDMVNTQSSIQNMRHKHKTMLEKLEKDEKVLLAEMAAFEEKLAQWDNRPQILHNTIVTKKVDSFNSGGQFCQEAVDFLKFVTESGGHDGGWTSDDHILYLKLRKRYKTPSQMAKCLHGLCPDLSVEEIMKHEKWYVKYVELKEKQKEAIKAWRENKNAEMAKQIEANKEEKLPKASVPYASTKKENKEEIQEKIDAWKKQKEAQRLQELELKKQEERKAKELEDKKRQETEVLRMEIKTWKRTKMTKEQEERLKKEIAEYKEREIRIANSKKLIKQFQSQDDFYIERMKRSRVRKRSQSLERPVRKNNAPRDPERLLKPTKQWIFRTLPKKDEDIIIEPAKQVCNVRFVPKLGVPAWRKCM